MDQNTIHRFAPETLKRIHRLKESLFDIDVALTDIDHEITTRLAEREHLVTLLSEAEVELEALMRRAA